MKLKIYQIDAFTDTLFSGNPAAVCPLPAWLPDTLLQQIAMENNLAETAFYVQERDTFQIRWFTPTVEVDLCGHATLATASVLFYHEGYTGNTISFFSERSGSLSVSRQDEYLMLDFPADTYEEIELTAALMQVTNISPVAAFKGKTDYMMVYSSESDIRNLKPVFEQITALPARGLIVTAAGDSVSFVSRFFAPQSGIPKDPVTGSAHTTLTPYWSQRLGKKELTAMQLSARGGYLKCAQHGDRVLISGQARLYMNGEIHLRP